MTSPSSLQINSVTTQSVPSTITSSAPSTNSITAATSAAFSAISSLPFQSSGPTTIIVTINSPKTEEESKKTKDDDDSSKVESLLKKGQDGGGIDEEKHKKIAEEIDKAIVALSKKAKTNLTSARSDLYQLSRISSKHYIDQKEKIFTLLIQLIKDDPITEKTSQDIVEIIKSLQKDLDPATVEHSSPHFRFLLIKTCCVALEALLKHYGKKNLGKVTEELKKNLIDLQNKFNRLSKSEETESNFIFVRDSAFEATKRIETDNRLWLEILQRIAGVASAGSAAMDKDFEGFIDGLKKAFEGLDDKVENRWFDDLFVLKDLVENSKSVKQKLFIILYMVKAKVSKSWEYYYGALEILEEVISSVEKDEIEILTEAIFGLMATNEIKEAFIKNLSSSKPILEKVTIAAAQLTAATSNKSPHSSNLTPTFSNGSTALTAMMPISTLANAVVKTVIAPKILGVLHLVNSTIITDLALKASDETRKHDVFIQKRSKGLCKTIIEKLNLTPQGRAFLLTKVEKQDPALDSVLAGIIPPSQIERQKWLRGTSAITALTKESDSKSISTTASTKTSIPFFDAIKEGRLDEVKKLLGSNSALIYEKDENDRSPLHIAAATGNVQIFNLINTVNEYINSIGNDGKTALMIAVEAGNVEICETLLNLKADSELLDKNKRTLLHLAAFNGQSAVVTTLIERFGKTLDLEAVDAANYTPLLLAAQKGHTEICTILINAKANPKPNSSPYSAIYLAVENNHSATVKLFAERCKEFVNLEVKGTTPLIKAIDLELRTICAILLLNGADSSIQSDDNMNAVHRAASIGNIFVLKDLLKAIKDKQLIQLPNKDGITPLMFGASAKKNRSEVCEELINSKANVHDQNKEDMTALHYAAMHEDVMLITKLITKNRDLIDRKTKTGLTALMIASKSSAANVESLLKHKADPTIKDVNGWNAMHFAASHGQSKVILKLDNANKGLINSLNNESESPLMLAAGKIFKANEKEQKLEIDSKEKSDNIPPAYDVLFELGADPTTKSKKEWGVIHFAASSGNITIVRKFIKEQRDTKTKLGQTPLMIAAANGHKEVCEAFLKEGADPFYQIKKDMNALHIAAQNDRSEIVELFKDIRLKDKRLIDSTTKDGYTALIICAKEGKINTWETLLKAGANYHATLAKRDNDKALLEVYKNLVNKKSSKGNYPLMVAMESEHSIQICRILLRAGEDPFLTNDEGVNALYIALDKGYSEIAKELSYNLKLLNSTLKIAIRKENRKIATKLLSDIIAVVENEKKPPIIEKGKDSLAGNANDLNALHVAASIDDIEIAKKLLESNSKLLDSDTTTDKITPIMIAAKEGRQKMCELLLKENAGLFLTDSSGLNAMHIAIRHGKNEIVELFSHNIKLLESVTKDDRKLTPLIFAIREGQLEACKIIIAKAPTSLLAKDDKGQNALQLAVSLGRHNISRLLLGNKELVNPTNAMGLTPLMLACQLDCLQIFDELLDAEANPNLKVGGQNILHFAVRHRKNKFVERLLNHKQILNKKEFINATTDIDETALLLAVKEGYPEICDTLLKSGADTLLISQGWSAIHFAAEKSAVIVSYLIASNEKLINITTLKERFTPLMIAAREGNREVCEILMKNYAKLSEIDSEGDNVMHIAVRRGRNEIVELFSNNKALLNSKNRKGQTPFTIAAEIKNLNICKILLAAPEIVLYAKQDWKALTSAAKLNESAIIQALSSNKKFVNSKTEDGFTPFFHAAGNGSKTACEILLKAGLSPLAENKGGWNALHEAASNGKKKILQLLAQNTQLLNSVRKDGASPLLCAAENGHAETCEILLAAGANASVTESKGNNVLHLAVMSKNEKLAGKLSSKYQHLVNSQNKNNETPLMFAAITGKQETVESLLKAGADLFAVDLKGRTVLHHAAHYAKTEITNLLLTVEAIRKATNQGFITLVHFINEGNVIACQTLLNAGVNPLQEDDTGCNAIHIVVKKGNNELVKLFSDNKELVNSETKKKSTPLILAINRDKTEICDILLKAGAEQVKTCKDIGAVVPLTEDKVVTSRIRNQIPLMRAVKKGNKDIVEMLLKHNDEVVVDARGWNALHYAIHLGKNEIVELLSRNKSFLNTFTSHKTTALAIIAETGNSTALEALAKADSNFFNNNTLEYTAERAIKNGKIEVLKVLVNYKLLTKDLKSSLLRSAAYEGHLTICQYLIQEGADPLGIGEWGYSILHSAAKSGKAEIIQFFSSNSKLINSINDSESTPLIIAAKNGHLEACEILLKAGADYLITNTEGRNAMHFAARNGHTNIVKLLLSYKILVHSFSFDDSTPLMLAARHGHRDICELLIEAGANVLATNIAGKNALHIAVGNEQIEVVTLLALFKPLINSTDINNATPLMLAAANGSVIILKVLLNVGADPFLKCFESTNAMHLAAARGHLEIVRILLKYKELINSKTDGSTPLMCAVRNDQNKKVCEILLKAGADPFARDDDDQTAMHLAANLGQTEMVSLLSFYKELIHAKDANGNTPLMLAVEKGHLETTKVLLKIGASPYEKVSGNNVMHKAIQKENVELVNILLSYEQLIHLKNKDGFTPLMFAALYGQTTIFEILLKAGADPYEKNDRGSDVMSVASAASCIEIGKLLLPHKKLINSNEDSRIPPLLKFIVAGSLEFIQSFIKAGADPLVKDYQGWTAMHYAVNEKIEFVKYFFTYPKLINAKSNDGTTPFLIAAKTATREICEAMIKAGADPLAKDNELTTTLHKAVAMENSEVVQLLLQYKELINAKDKLGNTPLFFATTNQAIFESLINNGADPSIINTSGDSILHKAAEKGNIEIVKSLLSNAKLIDLENPLGTTPLMAALRNGHSEICELLIGNGANPVKFGKGYSTLHYAIQHFEEDSKIFRHFLPHDQLINSVAKRERFAFFFANGETPLMSACKKGMVTLCETLLKRVSNVNSVDARGHNALHYAAKEGHDKVIKLLLPYKQLIDAKSKDNSNPLMVAAANGKSEAVEILMKETANLLDCDKEGNNAMHLAVRCGHIESVRILATHKPFIESKVITGCTSLLLALPQHYDISLLLLQCGANPLATDKFNNNGMHEAVCGKGSATLRLFLEHKSLINAKNTDGNTPLLTAAKRGNLNACEALITADADPLERNNDQMNALHMAVGSSSINVVKLFIKFNQLIDQTDNEKRNILHIAAENGKNSEIFDLLIQFKHLIHSKDKFGRTPILYSCPKKNGNLEIYEILVKAGANPKDVDNNGKSLLMFAADDSDSGNFKMCEVLLKAGVDPLLADKDGRTAMHVAVESQNKEGVILLSKYKELVNAKDKDGITPLMIAAKKGSEELCTILLNNGANLLIENLNKCNAIVLAKKMGKEAIVKLLTSWQATATAKK